MTNSEYQRAAASYGSEGGGPSFHLARAHELLAVVTLDGQIVRTSAAWAAVLGLDDATLLAGGWLGLIHADDRAVLHEARAALRTTGTLDGVELRLACGAYAYRWFSLRATLDPDGVTASVVAQDITARKSAAVSPRERQLLDAMSVAVIVTDLQGTILYWNAYATSLYGWTVAEAQGQLVGALTVHSIDPGLRKEIWQALRAGESRSQQFLAQRKDGSVFLAQVHNSPLLDDSGQLIGIVGSSIDISEGHAAQLALRDSEREHRQLLEQAADAIFIFDTTGKFDWVNTRATVLTGYTAEELLRRQIGDIMPADEAEKVAARIASLKDGARTRERLIKRRDGRLLSCEVSATLLSDGRVQVIIRDVSERRAAEAALRERDERFRLIAQATNDAIWDLDVASGRLWWNEGVQTLFGYTPTQIGPDLDWWIAHLDDRDRDRVSGTFHAALAGPGETWTEQYRFRRADGSTATVLDRGFILRDALGLAVRVLGSMQDITARQESEEALRAAHAREQALRAEAEQRLAELEAIIDSIPDAVYIGDATRITRANAAALRMLGQRSVAALSENYHQINELLQTRYVDSGVRVPPGQSVFATALTGRPRIREVVIRDRATGADRVIRCASAPVRVGGQIIGAVAVNTDITIHKLNEQALLASQALLSEAQRLAHLGSWEFDHDGGTLRFSDELYRIMGHDPQSFTPTTEKMLATIHDDDRERVRQLFRDSVEDATPSEVDFRVVRPDGEIRTIYQRAESLRDDTGRLTKRVGIMQDVTEQRTLEAQLRHQAFHDPLTGLPNRALFADRLGHALARARRTPGGCAVFFLDLDRFKTVNDSLGHAVGDQLLIAVAARLRGELRDGDTLARLGGDEFAVLLAERADLAEATRIAARLCDGMQAPIVIDGRELEVTISVGIAFSTPAESTPTDLLRFADMALYQAKAEGGDGWQVFSPGLNEQAVSRLELEHDLRRALERDELEVYYQPKVELLSGRIAALEALLRWRHPVRGLLLPGEFIPLAEETGLIVPLGRFVLRHACHQLRDWQRRYPEIATPLVAVNLSPREFRQPDLVAVVAVALAEAGLAPEQLTLEITETVAMEQLEESIVTLGALRDLGVRLAIDDFGTGYSSLAYLQQLPVQGLKIDRAFAPDGERNRAIVQAIAALAYSLNLEVTAEGLETAEQTAWARAVGCNLGQGYYFSPALRAVQIEALWERGLRYDLPVVSDAVTPVQLDRSVRPLRQGDGLASR